MLFLSQLITPQPPSFWETALLQALQGVGYVTQNSPTGQLMGTGSVSASGPATQSASVVVLISTSGDVGSGAFKYSTDGGVTFSSPITIPSGASSSSGNYFIEAIGITLTFANGSYLTPNQTGYFVEGESYSFDTLLPTFPVSDWEPVAASLSLIKADSISLADFSLTQSQVANGGYTQSWISPPPQGAPPSGWLDILSQNFYNRFRVEGQPTQGIERLSNSGAASQTIEVGDVLLQSASGQQFTNVTGGTLPGASGSNPGTLDITVQAVEPGASFNDIPTYDPNNLIPGGNYLNQIISPTIPGVTALNPINSTPACIHSGSGPSSINFTGTATLPFSVIFLITSSGTLGSSTYSYSLDGGNTYTDEGVTVASGVTINGMTVGFPSGSYESGDTYSFSTGWITQFGADTQSDVSLATADQNQWTQLSPVSPQGTYSNWAKAASKEVTNVFSTPSATVPGQVNVLLVGQNNGPVSVAAIAAVQTYITQRQGINDSVLVASVIPITAAITAGSGGTIRIHQSQSASVFAGVAAALAKLQAGIPPGGTIFFSVVMATIQDVPGVIEIIQPININGAQSDIPLNANEVANIVPPPQNAYTLLP